MGKIFSSALATSALMGAAAAAMVPSAAQAAEVFAGAGIGGNPTAVIDPFDLSTRGVLQTFASFTGQALTFAGTFNSAVYLNTLGTLDFYYQFLRTGAGSTSANNAVQSFTAQNFSPYQILAFRDGTDFDGAGGFSAANNPGTFTSGATRGFDGSVAGVDFGANNLVGTENSTTYIFRTNAVQFQAGTFGVIDGSTLQGSTFAPTGPAVPEPATWLMMILGFGCLGLALRRKAPKQSVRVRYV